MSDDVPFEVLEDFPETGDLSDQTGQDVIDPAQKVQFVIKNVKPDVYSDKETGQKMTARLSVRAAIGPLGVDGEGKYANKNLFQDLLTWYNADVYTSDWWKKSSRFPYKSFLKAVGYDPASPPKVTDAFLTELQGKEFIADIKKSEIQKKVDGKYQGTGAFRNELINFKAVE